MSLSHSNIAQVLDLGVSAGRYFLVLELVDGWDLGRVLHRAATAGVPPAARARAARHGRGLSGARLRPLQDRRPEAARDRSPRRQPTQHPAVRAGRGEADRLRHRQGDEQARAHRHRRGQREGRLHVARAGDGQADRSSAPICSRWGRCSTSWSRARAPSRGRPSWRRCCGFKRATSAPPEETAPDLPPEVAAVVARAMRKEPAERYQSADEMLGDVERVLRTAFQPVGQTELKRWLTELAARDGVAPISQSSAPAARTTSIRSKTGTGELEEEDVVLLDTDEEIIDGEEATSLAVVKGGGDLPAARHAHAADAAGSAGARGRRIDVRTSRVGRSWRCRSPKRKGAAGPSPRPTGQRVLDPLRRSAAGGGRLVRRQVRPDVFPDLVRGWRDREFSWLAIRRADAGGADRSRRGPADRGCGCRRTSRPARSRDAAPSPRRAETAEAPAPARHAEPAGRP